ncbi:hypothetical protein ABOB24_25510, partial [Escherichia coli]
KNKYKKIKTKKNYLFFFVLSFILISIHLFSGGVICGNFGLTLSSIKNSLLRYKNRPYRERNHRSGGKSRKAHVA